MNSPPSIRLYRGYDPHSRTLRGPFWTTGIVAERITEVDSHRCRINEAKPACFGESIPPGVAQWFDLGVVPQSGDTVMIWADGQQMCKQWREVNGEVFLLCHWYTVPLAWIPGVRAIGTLVAEVQFPGAYFPHIRHQVMTTDEDDVQWRRELNSRPKVHKALGAMLRA